MSKFKKGGGRENDNEQEKELIVIEGLIDFIQVPSKSDFEANIVDVLGRELTNFDATTIINKVKLCSALIESNTQILRACKIAGVCNKTYYNYYDSCSVFKDFCDSLKMSLGEFYENALIKGVQAGNTSLISLVNKTYNKHRYSEKEQIVIQKESELKTEHLSHTEQLELYKLLSSMVTREREKSDNR